MKQAIWLGSIVLVMLFMSGSLAYGSIRQGLVEPPIGNLRIGRLTLMSLAPCPTMPGAIFGPGRRCGSASPWMVWLVWRGSTGEPYQWELLSIVLNGG